MTIRIAKYIAKSGAASRRGAEELIASGVVALNGKTVETPVTFVNDGDTVTINGAPVVPESKTKLFAFHKPANCVTTTSDPGGRRTIYHCMPREYRKYRYVGRLDFLTSGLLLLTNDGELARVLTLPESNIPRTYIATVVCDDLSNLDIARRGALIDGIQYRPMQIDVLYPTPHGAVLRVVVCEGKKNEVRIVLRECGAPVRKLHRVSYGPIELKDLAPGKIRQIPQKTIDAILKTV